MFRVPTRSTVDVPAIDAGDYFFQCDVHPATMTGTLAVIESGGGGGGGGGLVATCSRPGPDPALR